MDMIQQDHIGIIHSDHIGIGMVVSVEPYSEGLPGNTMMGGVLNQLFERIMLQNVFLLKMLKDMK